MGGNTQRQERRKERARETCFPVAPWNQIQALFIQSSNLLSELVVCGLKSWESLVLHRSKKIFVLR